ncbi:DUF6344 domain-containing protein [Streptomyces geranii]|uniref:DUF6344 domain-containing protein n=1 Tax=Streptomyces geranii TaxID=2058923 RepID=UPI000D03AFEA|nr:DUF6344 domain-containing protein [Streptomyces geranii]
MAQNKVLKLWTAVVTAFLALCTTLGLITTTATAAVADSHPARNCATAPAAPLATAAWDWSYARSLPPTMKQRIRAEAHGSSPSCRHHSPADTEADTEQETATDAETAPQPLS